MVCLSTLWSCLSTFLCLLLVVVGVYPAVARPGPAVPINPSSSALNGVYEIGGGAWDFASIGQAVDSLVADGITGSTTLLVYPGTYSGPITFPAISGASAGDWIEFVPAVPGDSVFLSNGGISGDAVLTFTGASYVRLEGISIVAAGDPGQRALVIENGCSNLDFRDARISGSGSSLATSYAVDVRGTACDSLVFENLRIGNASDGLHLTASLLSGSSNRISACTIENVKRAVYADRQRRFDIEHCDLLVNAGSTAEVVGVFIGTLAVGDTVTVHGNRIHDLVTTASRAVGIKITSVDAASLTRVYNNFIYGFNNTGSSQIRAIDYASGGCEIYSNSVYINDVSATGWTYCVLHNNFNPAAPLKLRNNIFFNNRGSGDAYCIFIQSPIGALDSDFNIFHGTGTGYKLGRAGGADRLDLAAWQTATGGDAMSLAGDPQFAAEDDLHLGAEGGLAHQNGAPVSYITDDIDFDPRGSPPDRGADEYNFTAPPVDFAVVEILDVCALCPELSNVTAAAVVQNRGSETQTGVQILLSYLGVPRAEIYVTLDPLEIDTLQITWTTGFAPSSGELRIEAVLPDDPNQGDNIASAWISIIGQPLHGHYRIGGVDPDYQTFTAAINDLRDRSLSDSVVFDIAPGNYVESVVIPCIPDVAAERPVMFRKALDAEGTVALSADTGTATMLLDSARFITLDGISLSSQLPMNSTLRLDRQASHNRIHNCEITGPALTDPSAPAAIRVAGGGCDNNCFENTVVGGGYFGFRLDGSSSDPDSGVLIEGCTVTSAVRGIFVLRQRGCRIVGNTVHAGFDGAAVQCFGIYVASLVAGDTVVVENNLLRGGRGDDNLYGIFSASGSGVGLIRNNFICDWESSGDGLIYGIQIGSGVGLVLNNSIRMSEVLGPASMIGLSVTGSSTSMIARNNVVQLDECQSGSYAWKLQSGTLDSDFNAYYSSCDGDSFFIGWFGSNTYYETLAEWNAATDSDANSIVDYPGLLSEDDLHVVNYTSTLDGVGEAQPLVEFDVDGDPRGEPPDIGADEYNYAPPDFDYSVAWLYPPLEIYGSETAYTFHALVTNNGAQDQIDVPVRCFYNGWQQSETLISLAAGESDTAVLQWTTPIADLEGGIAAIQCFLDGDQLAWNDRVQADVVVAGPPLNGLYQIGGGTSDFASLEQAAEALHLRGVNGPVTVELYPGEYIEAVSFKPIPGAQTDAPILIRPVDGDSTSVVIRSATGGAVITLAGADYVTFKGLRVAAQGETPGAFEVQSGSFRNAFCGGWLMAPDSLDAATFGARFTVGDCDSNRIENTLVTGAYTGIHLSGGENEIFARENEIIGCRILHARYGIYVDDQLGARIIGNEIIPGSSSTIAAVCFGVFVTHLGPGGTVEIAANRIHGFADASGNVTNRAVGIYSSPGTAGTVTAYNNFIYDFSAVQSLKISAIYLSVGENNFYHNSIRIGDVPTTNEISAIYISAGNENDVRNNLLVSLEGDVVSRGIYALGGNPAICDYNNIYGNSPLFVTASLGTTDYPSISSWRTTGYGLNSVALDPHFLAPDDLHIDASLPDFDNLGDPAVGIPVDIDNETRATPPDIGADEFSYVITPDTPEGLVLTVADSIATLRWLPATNAAVYHIYSASFPGYAVDEIYHIATVADTFYIDNRPLNSKRFYKITSDSQIGP